jgi:hypothetical protein
VDVRWRDVAAHFSVFEEEYFGEGLIPAVQLGEDALFMMVLFEQFGKSNQMEANLRAEFFALGMKIFLVDGIHIAK